MKITPHKTNQVYWVGHFLPRLRYHKILFDSSLSHSNLLSPLLVDGLLAGDALYEPHVVQLALRLVLHPLPLLRLGLQARDDRPQRLHLLPDLKVDLQRLILYNL